MWGAISKVVLILAIILSIPTGAVLASQDAVPGEMTYPVKRFMENGITSAASLNPWTSAYFKTDFSKRRFKEAVALINKGQNASGSLTELVSQTQSAADSMKGVSDKSQRRQLIDSLTKQIDEYNQSFTKIEKSKNFQQSSATVTQTPQQGGSRTSMATPTPRPTQSSGDSGKGTSRTSMATPTSRPTQSSGDSGNSADLEQIRRTMEELEKLKQDLLEQAKKDAVAVGSSSSSDVALVNSTIAPTTVAAPRPTDTVNIFTRLNPTATPIPNATPTMAYPTSDPNDPVLNSAAMDGGSSSLGGRITGISPLTNQHGITNTPMTFTATGNDPASKLTRGELFVARISSNNMIEEMLDTECGNGNGVKANAPNQAWCNVGRVTWPGTEKTVSFTGNWTPITSGHYYVVVNIFSGTFLGSAKLWCSGNPWCTYAGQSSCQAGNQCNDCSTTSLNSDGKSTVSFCGGSSAMDFYVDSQNSGPHDPVQFQ